jgi:hypothetical protein
MSGEPAFAKAGNSGSYSRIYTPLQSEAVTSSCCSMWLAKMSSTMVFKVDKNEDTSRTCAYEPSLEPAWEIFTGDERLPIFSQWVDCRKYTTTLFLVRVQDVHVAVDLAYPFGLNEVHDAPNVLQTRGKYFHTIIVALYFS